MKIAIDGPAGAGKSTLAKALARELGFIYIDTGAMYRALTWKAIKQNIDINNEEALCELAQNTKIHFQLSPHTQKIICDNEDITRQIRSPEVSALVSHIAALPSVRKIMVYQQQKLSKDHNVVMDGRDIGEIVLPDAEFKFFITADINERTSRRIEELKKEGYSFSLEVIKEDLEKRDLIDSKRPVGALKILEDSIVIDTTDFTADEVLTKLLSIIQEA